MKSLIIILLTLTSLSLKGQSVVYYDTLSSRDLYRYDVENKQSQFIANLRFEPLDIAVDPEGILYGTDGSKLYTLDLSTLQYKLTLNLTNFVNSLVYFNKYTLFAIDTEGILYEINPLSGYVNEIGSSKHPSQGDIVISKEGLIYWTATDNHLYEAQPYPGGKIKDLGNLENMNEVKGLAIINSSI
jgi:outer membrane protein assembly factor BamB